jgi:hypothetical protein
VSWAEAEVELGRPMISCKKKWLRMSASLNMIKGGTPWSEEEVELLGNLTILISSDIIHIHIRIRIQILYILFHLHIHIHIHII